MKITISILFAIMIQAMIAYTGERVGEEINWGVISSGGSINGTSTNYQLSGTVAQTATGAGSSTNYGLRHGFWQEFEGPGTCCDHAGDANNNGAVNILDVTFIISYLYKSGAPPSCNDEADANSNGAINILDVTYLISYLYKGGAEPNCP